jgi:hypothetical protein
VVIGDKGRSRTGAGSSRRCSQAWFDFNRSIPSHSSAYIELSTQASGVAERPRTQRNKKE